MTEYLTTPAKTFPDFTFDNVYVTENIMVFDGSNLPLTRSSRNTLVFNGNLRANKHVRIVAQDFREFGPNDLFFNGNVYVAGDVMAELFASYGEGK